MSHLCFTINIHMIIMERERGILYVRWIPAHLLVQAKYISYSQISNLRKQNKIQAKYLNSTLMIDMQSIEDSLTSEAGVDLK